MSKRVAKNLIAVLVILLLNRYVKCGDPRDYPIEFRYCHLCGSKYDKNTQAIWLVCKYPYTGYYCFRLLPQGEREEDNGRAETTEGFVDASLDIKENTSRTFQIAFPDRNGIISIYREYGELWAMFDIDHMRFEISSSPVPIVAIPK